ncbi:MAG: hypothetical protein QOH25_2419 [Acidobacteriota bacterium]|nr:hypothetical protein [Acidobacteriota bacterium]
MKRIKTFLLIGSCLCFSTIVGCSSKSSEQSSLNTSAQPGNSQAVQPAVSPITSGVGSSGQTGEMAADSSQVADELHTPPKGSEERQAIMDALRDQYKNSRNSDGKPNRGNITFVVNYLKAHNGWAWTYAEPQSSDPNDQFGENSGFLLQQAKGQWKVMKVPPMVDDPDDPENLDYPTRKDIERIRKMYPSIPADIFPNHQ